MNAVTFESVYVQLYSTHGYYVLHIHIMCDKMYHPKNYVVLVYWSTFYTVITESLKNIFLGDRYS